MKTMMILRGISGSGKSTFAANIMNHSYGVTYCSADEFFMINGEYKFDPALLGLAHGLCFRTAAHAAMNGCEIIIIDNTNTQVWEMSPYVLMAQSYGYKIRIVRLEIDLETAAKRNLHGVPENAVERMWSRFEKPLPFWPKEHVFVNPSEADVQDWLKEG